MNPPTVQWRKFSKWIQQPSPIVKRIEESPSFIKQQEDAKSAHNSIHELIYEAMDFSESLQACSEKGLSFAKFMSGWSSCESQIPEVAHALSSLGKIQTFFCEMILLMKNHLGTYFIHPLKDFLDTDFAEYEKSKKRYEKMKQEYEELLSQFQNLPEPEGKFSSSLYDDYCHRTEMKSKYQVANQEVADHLMHVLLKKDLVVLEGLKSLLLDVNEFGKKSTEHAESYGDYVFQLESQVVQHKVAFTAMKKERADEVTRTLDENKKRKFHTLVELLAETNLDLVESMTEITKKDDFLRDVVSVLDGFNISLLLLKTAISQEISNTSSESTLFRASNIHTKFINMYCKMISQNYVRNLIGPTVTEILSHTGSSLEVDPQRMENPEDARENLQKLMGIAEKLFSTITSEGLKCPFRLRYALGYLKSETKRKFADARLNSVASFLFLRLYSPALMTPEAFGIVKEPISPQSRRGLVLVAKVLQNLANGIKFGEKESYMIPANPFIEAHLPQTHAFLEKIAYIPDSHQDNVSIITQQEAEITYLPQIHKSLVTNINAMEEYLLSKNRKALLLQLVGVLGSLGRPRG